MTQSSEEVF